MELKFNLEKEEKINYKLSITFHWNSYWMKIM